MALLASELARIKFELGYNGLGLSALPYAIDGITQLFEHVVQPYLQAGALTTSSTVVADASSPTNVTLTLASAVGFSVGDRIIVDQDANQEATHVSVVSGSNITVALQNAHAGTYPVTVEGAESIVRSILGELIALGAGGGRISRAAVRAGIKKVDEIEFFASTGDQKGVNDSLFELQNYWREELASALGVENLRASRSSAAIHDIEMY